MTKPLSQSSARAQRVLADLTALKVVEKDLEEEFVASPGQSRAGPRDPRPASERPGAETAQRDP